MADAKQLRLLLQGPSAWNQWREKHGGVKIDLSGANLREKDLSGAKFFAADLSEADLSEASLSGANLSGATVIQQLSGNKRLPLRPDEAIHSRNGACGTTVFHPSVTRLSSQGRN
jgi:hypothetical protein